MRHNFETLFKSKIHIEIITFFHENPTSIDTPRGVAAWTGYQRDRVKRALNELVSIGILTAHPASSTTGYSYTNKKQITKVVDKRLKALHK